MRFLAALIATLTVFSTASMSIAQPVAKGRAVATAPANLDIGPRALPFAPRSVAERIGRASRLGVTSAQPLTPFSVTLAQPSVAQRGEMAVVRATVVASDTGAPIAGMNGSELTEPLRSLLYVHILPKPGERYLIDCQIAAENGAAGFEQTIWTIPVELATPTAVIPVAPAVVSDGVVSAMTPIIGADVQKVTVIFRRPIAQGKWRASGCEVTPLK